MTGRFALPVLGAAATAAVAAAGGDGPLRATRVVGFLLLCPGVALALAIGVRGAWETLALGITLSIAVDVLVAAAFMYSGAWSPTAVFVVLLCVTAAASGAVALREGRA